jgi:D-ribose pyranose/furanose isomerase RbsD
MFTFFKSFRARGKGCTMTTYYSTTMLPRKAIANVEPPQRHTYKKNYLPLARLDSKADDHPAPGLVVGDAILNEHIVAATKQYQARKTLAVAHLASSLEVAEAKKRETGIILESISAVPVGQDWAQNLEQRMIESSAALQRGMVDLQQGMVDLRKEMNANNAVLRQEMNANNAALQQGIEQQMKENNAVLRHEMKEENAALRQEMNANNAVLRQEMNNEREQCCTSS